jgi:DNA-binding winged helix-turn-helix (wHTH) protein/Tol biopolymer transport system component
VNPPSERLEFGPVTLIRDERIVLKNGQPVPFTPKAFDLLSVLASNPGRLLTKEQLMQAVWPDTVVEESNLTYHIFAIRKSLGEDGNGDRYIETVPKRGYRFVAPVTDTAAAPKPESPAAVAQSAGNATRKEVATGLTRRQWIGLMTVPIVGTALIGGVAYYMRKSAPQSAATPPRPHRFREAIEGRLPETEMFQVSPDGQRYIYAAEGSDGVMRLWLKEIDAFDPVALPGTEVYTIIPPAVWAPDSRSFAFNPGSVKKGSIDGGMPQELCAFGTAVGGDWNGVGQIVLGNAGDRDGGGGGLVLCSAAGSGPAVPVTTAEPGEFHLLPSFLSDGRRFIYLKVFRKDAQRSGIFIGELPAEAGTSRTTTRTPLPTTRLITTGFHASFVRSVDERLPLIVFARDEALYAQRFDEASLTLKGDAMRIADRIGSFYDGAFFSVSPTMLIYREPTPGLQLTWYDRRGNVERVGQPARYADLTLSPSGSRIVAAIQDSKSAAGQDLWLFEPGTSGNRRMISTDSEMERGLVFSDEDHVLFGSGAGMTTAYRQHVDRPRGEFLKHAGPITPSSISTDQDVVLFTTATSSPPSGDVWVAFRQASGYAVKPLIQGTGNQSDARLSPDRRRVAYVSDESGPNEVHVSDIEIDVAAGVATLRKHLPVSRGGGFSPRWSRDGGELFYLTGDGSVWAVPVDSTSGVRSAEARILLKLPRGFLPQWDVSPDRRMLFALPVAETPPFHCVRDWQLDLRD